MKKNSSNYKKQRQKIAKLHAKTKHQRNDLLHKLSCQLVNTYHVVGIEDLDMAGMRKSLNYGKSVSDIGWGNFVRMLTYKAERTGCHIIKIDRWFPSSKTCMVCGYVHKELSLNNRIYFCPCCGNVMDRDHQAAINIDREAMRIYREEIFPLIA
jgi:putative transposase